MRYHWRASPRRELLVFVSAIVAGNVSTIGGLSLGCLLLTSATLLGLCNYQTKNLQMFGRTLNQEGPPKAYHHRLDSAREFIAKIGRDDWAIALGFFLSPGDTTIPLLASSIVPGTLIDRFYFHVRRIPDNQAFIHILSIVSER
jgi:hypothetical protein